MCECFLFSQNKKAIFIQVVDSLSNDPVPFSRISYSRNRSLLTDEKGKGVLFYSPEEPRLFDTLKIWASRFSQKTQVIELNKIKHDIKLKPEAWTLTEVELTCGVVYMCTPPLKLKNEAGGFVSTDGKRKGAEVASMLEWKKNKIGFLRGVEFEILKNLNPDTVFLRINIYTIKNNFPDSLILSRMIKVLPKEIPGKKDVMIEEFPLKPGQKLAIGLECLSEHSGLDKFCFSTSGKLEGWVRYPGFSTWKIIRGGAFLFFPRIFCE
ncbi:MAG: hypothetical protein N3F09_01530 [Bacteroidia bacterium]|nr:hypothetical protein [Bacteroidia bacterium]